MTDPTPTQGTPSTDRDGAAPEPEPAAPAERPRSLIPPVETDARRLGLQTLRLIAVAVLLPNAIFWLMGWTWVIRRPALNLDYALIPLLHPWLGAVGGGLLAGVFALTDAMVAGAYHYCNNPACLLQAAPEVARLPLTFTLPIAGVLVGGAGAIGWSVRRLLKPLPRRSGPGLLAAGGAFALALGLAPIAPGPQEDEHAVALGDFIDNAVVPALAMATEYRGLTARPIPSATEPLFTALDAGAGLPDRVVLVIMESWGVFLDAPLDALATRALDDPRIYGSYAVERGRVRFDGATVKGEIRELCRGQSASVRPDPELLPIDECLPRLFGGRGYHTVALHGFRRDFFERENWWPALGFDARLFRPEMMSALGTHRTCGQEWEGVCDTEAVQLLDERLAQYGAGSEPLFLYWLTLNAHGPYHEPPEDATPLPGCDPAEPGAPPKNVCAFLSWHDRALSAVVDLAARNADGRTAWVIVGDHAPRFHTQKAEALISQEEVPWIRLWPKAVAASTAAAVVSAAAGPGGRPPRTP